MLSIRRFFVSSSNIKDFILSIFSSVSNNVSLINSFFESSSSCVNGVVSIKTLLTLLTTVVFLLYEFVITQPIFLDSLYMFSIFLTTISHRELLSNWIFLFKKYDNILV